MCTVAPRNPYAWFHFPLTFDLASALAEGETEPAPRPTPHPIEVAKLLGDALNAERIVMWRMFGEPEGAYRFQRGGIVSRVPMSTIGDLADPTFVH